MSSNYSSRGNNVGSVKEGRRYNQEQKSRKVVGKMRALFTSSRDQMIHSPPLSTQESSSSLATESSMPSSYRSKTDVKKAAKDKKILNKYKKNAEKAFSMLSASPMPRNEVPSLPLDGSQESISLAVTTADVSHSQQPNYCTERSSKHDTKDSPSVQTLSHGLPETRLPEPMRIVSASSSIFAPDFSLTDPILGQDGTSYLTGHSHIKLGLKSLESSKNPMENSTSTKATLDINEFLTPYSTALAKEETIDPRLQQSFHTSSSSQQLQRPHTSSRPPVHERTEKDLSAATRFFGKIDVSVIVHPSSLIYLKYLP
jgi:hypothetical protein